MTVRYDSVVCAVRYDSVVCAVSYDSVACVLADLMWQSELSGDSTLCEGLGAIITDGHFDEQK